MIRRFFRRFFYRLLHEDLASFAAQITFYLILSIFPFIIFVSMILMSTQLLTPENIMAVLQDIHAIPEAAKSLIFSIIQGLERDSSTYFSLFIIVIIYSASKYMRGIMNGIHMAYRTLETRSIITRFLLSFLYTISFAIMIVLFVALVLFGSALSKAAFDFLGLSRIYLTLITYLRYSLPFLFMFLTYLFLYRFIPTRPLKFKNVVFGALFATIASFVVSEFFSYSVSDMSRYTTLYGGIAQIIILIIWLYFISMIQLIGAILNATILDVKEYKD